VPDGIARAVVEQRPERIPSGDLNYVGDFVSIRQTVELSEAAHALAFWHAGWMISPEVPGAPALHRVLRRDEGPDAFARKLESLLI
jgi:hypothetical protein